MDLTGRSIKAVREMTREEMDAEGWDSSPMVIELDNGVLLYPSRDPEGNGPGAMFAKDGKDLLFVQVTP